MKKWNIDTALQKFKKLKNGSYQGHNLSEADTRSKIIDYLLFDCMGWTESDVVREERCVESNTYLDYKVSTNIPIIIIEAKKNTENFELPVSGSQREYKVGGVLSNCKSLLKAMVQARDYAISKGITFCCVTNGYEYIFFRAQNQLGIDWVDHKVSVYRGIEDIESNFDSFCRHISKASAERGCLHKTLLVSGCDENGLNKFKTLDTSHLNTPRKKDRNTLFPIIGDIVHRVFQDLASEEAESEILEHCYVDSPKKRDKNMPYLDVDTKHLDVTKKGAGDFQQRVTSALKAGKTDHMEVVLLIGSVGVGKSTFIQRFRKVISKDAIDNDGIWIYLNFKKFSDTGESLDSFIYDQIDGVLDREYNEYGIGDWKFIKQAYHPEYEKLKRGTLAPLFEQDPVSFEVKFSARVEAWSAENRENHFVKLLSLASRQLKKSVFLVFDNADQLCPNTQNDIFLAAQKLADRVKCYALIAMREESYWKNRDSGPLNAFHTTAYHVQPPSLKQVLSKRFTYAKNLIENNVVSFQSHETISSQDLAGVIDRVKLTLLGEDERYIEFIESTSARDTRRALDNVAAFLISGHTNIDAILRDEQRKSPDKFPIPFHEFLNAVILRDHEYFIEEFCDILNIFDVSGHSDANNFNRIAVLGRVLKAKNNKSELGTGYVLLEEVINDCHSVGILPETTVAILSLFNSRRLVETETTIKDSLGDSRYIRATISGDYYLSTLSKYFGYLDLIIYVTPICGEKYFQKINKVFEEINGIRSRTSKSRLVRVKKRLDLASNFIDFLSGEFSRCSYGEKRDLFSENSIDLMRAVRSNFDRERVEVEKSAEAIFGGG